MMILMFLLAQATNCSEPIAQMEMNRCAWEDHQREDTAMTAQWRKTLAYMRKQDRDTSPNTDKRRSYSDTLLESQRAWLRYRDTQCAIEGYVARGGSMEPMLIAACKAKLTAARRRDLAELMVKY